MRTTCEQFGLSLHETKVIVSKQKKNKTTYGPSPPGSPGPQGSQGPHCPPGSPGPQGRQSPQGTQAPQGPLGL